MGRAAVAQVTIRCFTRKHWAEQVQCFYIRLKEQENISVMESKSTCGMSQAGLDI